MTSTFSSELQDGLNRANRDLAGLEILGSSIYMLIRIPLYFTIKDIRNTVGIKKYQLFLRHIILLSKLLVSCISSWLLVKRLPLITGETIFVVDHATAKDVEFQSLILKYFDHAKTQIISANPLVPPHLDSMYADLLYKSFSIVSMLNGSTGFVCAFT